MTWVNALYDVSMATIAAVCFVTLMWAIVETSK
jgi:hypothetical protein